MERAVITTKSIYPAVLMVFWKQGVGMRSIEDEVLAMGDDDHDETFTAEELKVSFTSERPTRLEAVTMPERQPHASVSIPYNASSRRTSRLQRTFLSKKRQPAKTSMPVDEELMDLLDPSDTSFCIHHPHELAPYQCLRCSARLCYICSTQVWKRQNPELAKLARRQPQVTKKPWQKLCGVS